MKGACALNGTGLQAHPRRRKRTLGRSVPSTGIWYLALRAGKNRHEKVTSFSELEWRCAISAFQRIDTTFNLIAGGQRRARPRPNCKRERLSFGPIVARIHGPLWT